MDGVEELGRTPLMYSSMADRVECVELLLKRGASTAVQDGNGQTAVHWAAVTGSYRCLRVLLGKSPNLGTRDRDGR